MKEILDVAKSEEFIKRVMRDKNLELEYVYGNKKYA